MKPLNKTSVSFGRHETFALRFGWLTKGFQAYSQNPSVFESNDATVTLGVGKNMVHAIRYWLIASQILETDGNSLKSTELGRLIFGAKNGYDPYLEDDATIWLLHWLIASNAKNATTFFWFFNYFNKPEYTQKELFDALHEFVSEQLGSKTSANTLKSDITLLLRMYEPTTSYRTIPIEEGLDSPLSMLGLINEINDTKYHESKPENRWNLPIAPFSYAVLEIFDVTQLSSISVHQLMISDGMYAVPGTVFRLNGEGIIAKLEEMIAWLPGYFELRETAGIHQLYKLKNMKLVEILAKYYNEYRNSRPREDVA